MPRAPKHIRDQLKAAGQWRDPDHSPPSFSDVDLFSSGVGDPVPMPGAFTPVFNTMAHLPDVDIGYDYPLGLECLRMEEAVQDLAASEPRFAETGLAANEVSDRFNCLASATAAVKVAKAHSELGLGDTGLECFNLPDLPMLLAEAVSRIGEFIGIDGRKWLFPDIQTIIKAFTRMAVLYMTGIGPEHASGMFWLPTEVDDGHTISILAARVERVLSEYGVILSQAEFMGYMFSGSAPACFTSILSKVPRQHGIALSRLFCTWSTLDQFKSLFSDQVGRDLLILLELHWLKLDVKYCCFYDNDPKVVVKTIFDWWECNSFIIKRPISVLFCRQSSRAFVGSDAQPMRTVRTRIGFKTLSCYPVDPEDRTYAVLFGTPLVWSEMPLRYTSEGSASKVSALSIAASSLTYHA